MTKHSRSNKNKPAPSEPFSDTKPLSEKVQRVTLWQALLLPLAAILIFFLLVEGGLTLIGVKPALTEEDPFVGFASNVPLFVSGPAPQGNQLLTTAANKLEYFNQQTFPARKAAGTYRIFSLGGSTTYGRPYNDATSFSGWLRELLPEADRSKNWEVINAGAISYASYRVAHLMEELINYQPDLFIIYTGHNEFLEERTYHKLKQMPAVVRSTVGLLAHTRTWAGMKMALNKLGAFPEEQKGTKEQLSVEVNTILDRSVGPDRYSRDDQLRENILQHYRISLKRMAELARSAGAKVIFVTPASNLKECTPFKSQHSNGLDAAEIKRSEKLLAEAKAATDRENWQGALTSLDTALAFDPRDAELLYRRGQVLLALGRNDEAETALRQARDEDVCPLRALTPMRRIVSEVARDQGAPLVDFVDILQQRTQREHNYPIPGKEYFLDHVHPTIEGNKLLALALINTMIDQGLVQTGNNWSEQAIAEVATRIEGGIDNQTHGQALANLARVLLWAGKTEDAARLANQALEIGGEHQQIAVDASSILTSVAQREGDPQRALELMYETLKKAPGAVELHLKLGMALITNPYFQPELAAAHLLLACQQLPTWDSPEEYFGKAMIKRGRLDLAYASLQEALRLNPNNANARQLLAQVSKMLGGQSLNPQMPQIVLSTYPSLAPRRLLQVRQGSDGRPVPEGIEVEFFENGRIKRFQDYQQGLKDGLELKWDEKGQQLSRVIFDRGTPLKNKADQQ